MFSALKSSNNYLEAMAFCQVKKKTGKVFYKFTPHLKMMPLYYLRRALVITLISSSSGR